MRMFRAYLFVAAAAVAFGQPTVNTAVVPGALSSVLSCQAGSASCAAAVNQSITPGALVAIFGSNLAAALAQPGTVTLSTSLADVSSVQINGIASPIALVSPAQINVQVPWELDPTSGSASIVVTNGLGPSQKVRVPIVQYAPTILNASEGGAQALATNADGSLNGPAGIVPGATTHAASAGDNIAIYATGLGPVTPSPVDGAPSSDQPRNTNTVPVVMIGGISAQVVSSALSPQFVGVYVLSVVVPQGAGTGPSVPVQVQIGGAASVNLSTLTLQ